MTRSFRPGRALRPGLVFLALAAAAPAAERDAFRRPAPDLSPAQRMEVVLGEAIFEKLWVPAPASTKSSDGLGPLYDARSCAGCHVRTGRGVGAAGMAVRLIPADPVYGDQLQRRAAAGLAAEAALEIDWREREVALAGGEVARLRRPVLRLDGFSQGPLAARTALSPRMAPPLAGMGALAAIPDAAIAAHADPDDADGDGVSGEMAGRFGLRAQFMTLEDQIASAFHLDLGLSTALRPDPAGDCTEAQAACRAAPHGAEGGLEIGAELFALTAAYLRHLAPPAPRPRSPAAMRGEARFAAYGCAACHAPGLGDARPYSDLLLHDMGEGLADAGGAEWRTAPLWGLGATQIVAPGAGYLHDGRARSLLEAILWHGGEADSAREALRTAPPADRADLIAFLESL